MAKLQTLMSGVPMLDTKRVQTIQAGSWRTSDQTAAQRGYGYKWQQARAQVDPVDDERDDEHDAREHVVVPQQHHRHREDRDRVDERGTRVTPGTHERLRDAAVPGRARAAERRRK